MNHQPCPLCRHATSHLKYTVENFHIVTCRECGFVYLANPVDLAEEQQNYENYFQSANLADYRPQSTDKNIRQAWSINEQRLAWIQRYTKKGKLLDIGCGRGYFLTHAKNQGYHVQGMEISRLAARYASEKFDLMVQIGNIDEDTVLEEEFDIITLWHVLEHFQNPRTVLENVLSMLRPNGRLYIEVPNLYSLKFQLSLPKSRWRGGNHPMYHRSFFARDSLKRIMEISGFDDIKEEHLVYAAQSRRGIYAAKKLLNIFFKDSFLNVTATKQPHF